MATKKKSCVCTGENLKDGGKDPNSISLVSVTKISCGNFSIELAPCSNLTLDDVFTIKKVMGML